MPRPRGVLGAPQPGLPAKCQHGHALTWLLDGTEPNGDGGTLAACECAVRREDGRTDAHNGSTPCLWRYVTPGMGAVSRMTPVFPSMNRAGFALAVRLYRLKGVVRETTADVQGATDQVRRAGVLAAQAARAAGRLETVLQRTRQGQNEPRT